VERLSCRLLPYGEADGPHNMAADEALLESAARGVASLRFYGWSEATLSLGYFQAHRVRFADPRLATLPWVRRPSGGAALVHDREVTYALALPAAAPWQAAHEPVAAWLGRAHAILAAALADLGVDARAWTEPGSEPFTGFLCFQHLTPGDLVLGADKVVGSAQRRQRGALLQHGAVLLAASDHAPVLPGIRERGKTHLTAAAVRHAACARWARATGWDLAAGDWTSDERRRVGELIEAKYARSAWNARR
jgi:lipoate-protein ligase A